MNKTKIDWADTTWNPVTGCLHGCEYCYARKIAERFCTNEHGTKDGLLAPCNGSCQDCSEMDGFEFVGDKIRFSHNTKQAFPYGFMPTFYQHRLDEPAQTKKPQNIFVCSMADLFGDWVPDEWIQSVFKACEAAPWHRYLFLTKNPHRYKRIKIHDSRYAWKYDDDERTIRVDVSLRDQVWLGETVTNQRQFDEAEEELLNIDETISSFLSVEPIIEPIAIRGLEYITNWLIIGAETGNRKGKVIPEKKWILDILEQCVMANVPIFMKESLRELMGDDFIQMYPWEGVR